MRPEIVSENDRPFRSHCLDRFFFAILLAFLAGCSARTPTRAVSLEGAILAPAQWTASLVADDPHVYRLSALLPDATNSRAEFFATAIEGCGLKEYVPWRTITRDLLVGFTNITVHPKEPITIEGTVVHAALLNARLDDEPVTLRAFSTRDGECVRDIVVWGVGASIEEVPEALLQEFLSANLGAL